MSTSTLRLCFILRPVACLFWRISWQRASVWGKSKNFFYICTGTAFMGSGHVNLYTFCSLVLYRVAFADPACTDSASAFKICVKRIRIQIRIPNTSPDQQLNLLRISKSAFAEESSHELLKEKFTGSRYLQVEESRSGSSIYSESSSRSGARVLMQSFVKNLCTVCIRIYKATCKLDKKCTVSTFCYKKISGRIRIKKNSWAKIFLNRSTNFCRTHVNRKY